MLKGAGKAPVTALVVEEDMTAFKRVIDPTLPGAAAVDRAFRSTRGKRSANGHVAGEHTTPGLLRKRVLLNQMRVTGNTAIGEDNLSNTMSAHVANHDKIVSEFDAIAPLRAEEDDVAVLLSLDLHPQVPLGGKGTLIEPTCFQFDKS